VTSSAQRRQMASGSNGWRGSAGFLPENVDRGGDAAPGGAVGAVVLEVDGRAGSVVLADPTEALRPGEGVVVGGTGGGRDGAVDGTPAVEEGVHEGLRRSGEQPLRQVRRLGKEEQVECAQRHVRAHGLPHVQDGHDVEDRQVADGFGMLQRQPLRDQPSAVVAGHGEALVAKIAHEREHVARHRAFAEVRNAGRAVPVAGQVGTDHGELRAQPLTYSVPAPVGLRETVQQQQRRPGALDDVMQLDRAHDAPSVSGAKASTRCHSSAASAGWYSRSSDGSVNRCPSPG